MKCEVFRTVSTSERKDFVKKIFPELKDQNFGINVPYTEKKEMGFCKNIQINSLLYIICSLTVKTYERRGKTSLLIIIEIF